MKHKRTALMMFFMTAVALAPVFLTGAFSMLNLATQVAGSLGIANGGTGATTAATARTALGVAASSTTYLCDGTNAITGNIKLGTYWLSGDGGNEGIYVSSLGYVGVGTATPQSIFTVAVSGSYMNITGNAINFSRAAGNSFIDKLDANDLVFRMGSSSNAALTIKSDLTTILANAPAYADHAAAVSAGRPVGTIFRVGDSLQIVH